MEESFISLLINGHYSDWFFNVFLTNISLGIKNNLASLLLFAVTWNKVSKLTKTKWDDRASNWLLQKLTRKKND